ncbi:hypothetical protein Vafri_19415, partial [Volvox africanus]
TNGAAENLPWFQPSVLISLADIISSAITGAPTAPAAGAAAPSPSAFVSPPPLFPCSPDMSSCPYVLCSPAPPPSKQCLTADCGGAETDLGGPKCSCCCLQSG